MNQKLAIYALVFICVLSLVALPVSAQDFGDLRITGPHSQDHYLYLFSVRAGDPINLELKLSKYIGFWNPQGFQWINVTVYDSNASHVWSEYVETGEWSGVAKPKTFRINKTGTYILAANYTNGTDHCFAATMFFVL